jgi:hypothetical protein
VGVVIVVWHYANVNPPLTGTRRLKVSSRRL